MEAIKNSNGIVRTRRINYSQVSNYAIRDKNLSMMTRGLYSFITSYITIPDFTIFKSFLKKESGMTEWSFDKSWAELKEKGYLIQYKLKDKNGRWKYEYELLDEPASKEEIEEMTAKIEALSTPCNSNPGETGGYNNTYINKNRIDRFDDHQKQEKYETEINNFFAKVKSLVGESFFAANETVNTELKKFLATLTEYDLCQIACMDENYLVDFYLKAVELYTKTKDCDSPTGYLVSIIRNDGFDRINISKKTRKLLKQYQNGEKIPQNNKKDNEIMQSAVTKEETLDPLKAYLAKYKEENPNWKELLNERFFGNL